jgi:hypothetical protein
MFAIGGCLVVEILSIFRVSLFVVDIAIFVYRMFCPSSRQTRSCDDEVS